MAKILLVEDDRTFCGVVQDALSIDRHQLEITYDGREGLAMLKSYKYDLIIIDWTLPYLSGVDLCKEFRAGGGKTPVLMLTARKSVDEKAFGLDAGADDYLTKPFHIKELCARVRALLRRGSLATSNTLAAGNLVLESTEHKVTIDGREISISPNEFSLLEFLMRYPEVVFNPDAILDRVWASESESTAEAVRTCIRRLRRKLASEGASCDIQVIYGVGYKFMPERPDGDA